MEFLRGRFNYFGEKDLATYADSVLGHLSLSKPFKSCYSLRARLAFGPSWRSRCKTILTEKIPDEFEITR